MREKDSGRNKDWGEIESEGNFKVYNYTVIKR